VISFRYHLVTIVAVFLALALGVLAGTTVIKSGLVTTLKNNTRSLEGQLHDAQTLISELDQVRDAMTLWSVPNLLAGQGAIVVTDDKSDPAGARNAADVLTQAGANVDSITVTSLLQSRSEAGPLADTLCVSRDTPQPTLVGIASTQLADRLSKGAAGFSRPNCPAGTPDLLVSLLQQGFVTSPDVNPGDADKVGGPGQLAVVSAGGQGTPGVPITTFMEPLVNQFVQDGNLTAAVETKGTQIHPFVPLIRSDPNLTREHLVTVDDMEQKEGRLALALGFERMIRGGSGGDYGTKPGADEAVPLPP
jgi:Copper transport outer membrane protein, MctB